MKKIKKYIKFKPFENNDMFKHSTNTNNFHKENEGKVFEVVSQSGDYYYIRENGGGGLFKERFEEVKLVNLPDELFTM